MTISPVTILKLSPEVLKFSLKIVSEKKFLMKVYFELPVV